VAPGHGGAAVNIWRGIAVSVRQGDALAADGLVTCADCARFRPVGHRAQVTRSEWCFIHRQKYENAPGCGLTGEHLAADKPRRCENFEGKKT